MADTVEEKEIDYEEYESPTEFVDEKHGEGVLSLVGVAGSLSHKAINRDGLVRARAKSGGLNRGNIPIADMSAMEELAEKYLFTEYICRYMTFYGDEKLLKSDEAIKRALDYQIEAIIVGGDSDEGNLENIAARLLFLRTAANTIYIVGDDAKKGVAELLATAIATLVCVPEIADALTYSILIAWAFVESVYDVKVLLKGERVPLMKDKDSWHYGLSGALDFGNDEPDGWEDGLLYTDYLKLFMLMISEDELTLRAMDMVEADMRMYEGNSAFRLDGCIAELETLVTINSAYGYSYSGTRYKKY